MPFTVADAYNVMRRFGHYSPKTIRPMQSIQKLYVEEFWQNFDLMSITSVDVERFAKFLLEEKNQTHVHTYRILRYFRALLNKSKKFGFLNIMLPEIPRFPIDSQRIRFLSPDEAREILDLLKEQSPTWYDIVLLTLNTGMRLGEVIALRGENFDPVRRRLTLFKTKNGKMRQIPLNDTAFEICKKHCGRSSDYFFESSRNKKRPLCTDSKVFSKILKKTTINEGYSDTRYRICFHSLRHTFASWLVQQGVALEVISELLGHSSIQMTQRYAHLAGNAGDEAVAKLPCLT